MSVGAGTPGSPATTGSGPSGTSAQDVADQAREKAQDLAGQAQQVAGQAQERISDVAGQAQQRASQAIGQTQDRVRDQVDQRSSQVGEQITHQASDLREVADALREKGQDGPAQLAERLAGYAEQAGGYLSEADLDRLLADAEDLGRRRPGTVALGALAVGFAASRFLKASSRERYSSASGRGAQLPRPAATPEPPRSSLGADTTTQPRDSLEDSTAAVAPIGAGTGVDPLGDPAAGVAPLEIEPEPEVAPATIIEED